MTLRSRAILVVMIVLYILMVRTIFGWLAGGGSFPITARFPHDVWHAIPFLVAVVCIVGIASKQRWAWWLTLLALAYELITFGGALPRILGLSAFGALGAFKFLWLLGMLALLITMRKR